MLCRSAFLPFSSPLTSAIWNPRTASANSATVWASPAGSGSTLPQTVRNGQDRHCQSPGLYSGSGWVSSLATFSIRLGGQMLAYCPFFHAVSVYCFGNPTRGYRYPTLQR